MNDDNVNKKKRGANGEMITVQKKDVTPLKAK